MRELDNYYLQQEEPAKGCLLALREIILSQDKDISAAWKYRMPFFCYKGKILCYLWVDKKLKLPYLGFIEGKWLDHPDLIIEKRSRIKILRFDPNNDLPIATIETVLEQAISLYKTGVVKIKA